MGSHMMLRATHSEAWMNRNKGQNIKKEKKCLVASRPDPIWSYLLYGSGIK